ncbi:hypothetical protein JCM10213_008942, partial [Rhodosporidiobolus nylandii]
WKLLHRIFAYLSTTVDVGLSLGLDRKKHEGLAAFVDADLAGDPTTRKSTTGAVLTLDGSVISTISRRQTSVATSTFQSELIAMSTAVVELEYANSILSSLPIGNDSPLLVRSDNLSGVNSVKDIGYVERAKHADVKLRYIREQIERGFLNLEWIPGVDNPADLLTKPLPTKRAKELGVKLGLVGWPEVSGGWGSR